MRNIVDLYPAHVERLNQQYGQAAERAGLDGIVIHAGAAKIRSSFDDQYWPLTVTPAFAHWLPLREAECVLVIQTGATPVLLRVANDSYWEGPAPAESDHFWSSFDVREVAADEIAKNLPSGIKLGFIGECTERASEFGIDVGQVNSSELIAALDAIRAIKSDYERACIAEANRRAARGHVAVTNAFASSNDSELALHLLYLQTTSQDSLETPYQNIVALGEHGATLHHVNYGRTPSAETSSLLVDAGATCLGYASDITRAAVKGDGDGAAEYRALIAQMDAMQQTLCREVAPGLSFEHLHNRCHELLAGVLREVGIASASADELVSSGATRKFLPHGLGHSLGIQVHDVGCRTKPPDEKNPFLRNTSTIEVGHVFTVEPGCYFIGPLMAELEQADVAARLNRPLIKKLSRFGGVRIEDNIAVTTAKPRNLTRDNWPGTP